MKKKLAVLVLALCCAFTAMAIGTSKKSDLTTILCRYSWLYYKDGQYFWLTFSKDGTYTYGSNNSRYPEVYALNSEPAAKLLQKYNMWATVGKWTIRTGNIVSMDCTSAAQGNIKTIWYTGKHENWIISVISEDEIVIQTDNWTRTFKCR